MNKMLTKVVAEAIKEAIENKLGCLKYFVDINIDTPYTEDSNEKWGDDIVYRIIIQ